MVFQGALRGMTGPPRRDLAHQFLRALQLLMDRLDKRWGRGRPEHYSSFIPKEVS